MASVKEYLKKLLYQYDCVVVPELGAFLTHYQSASFTETSGLYQPPRKRVAFNEALRLDDGILANYIMLHEPVTREGAQRHISTFVNELRQQIQAIGHFEIDGIGTFSRNDEGRLQFDPSLRHNFFGEAYGMSAISAQTLNHQLESHPALEAVPVTAVGPVLVRDEKTSLVPLRRSRPYWRVAAATLLIGSLGLASYFSVIKPDQPLQSSLDPANLLRVSSAYFSHPADRNEVSEPLAIRKATPVHTTVAVGKPATSQPAVAATASVAEPQSKPVVEPVTKSTVPSGSPVSVVRPARTGPYFTVIAGSFSSKRNALRLRRQLRKAGYDDAFVIAPLRRGQLYKVAATGSSDPAEAVASVAAISELAGTPAWIYKN